MRLTDEEILALGGRTYVLGDHTQEREIAKAQLKKVVEWGIKPCFHSNNKLFKRECPYCWQALLDETK